MREELKRGLERSRVRTCSIIERENAEIESISLARSEEIRPKK